MVSINNMKQKEWTKSDTVALAAKVIGRLGGLARSYRKTAANRINAKKPRTGPNGGV
jgi:hypothetical protein